MKEGRNRLGKTASPYLLQHKANPVHWYAWGEEALEAARAENKPILLSIGYAACHWCHVMAHESFENPAIAELMNRLYINIKVDREERPDLDAIYQQALALLGQQGGWPLTMFLLPDTKPFWGGTYFPPESRWGRPGFPEVLTKIADIYRSEKDKVLGNSRELMAAMSKLAQPKSGEQISPELWDRIAARLLQEVDWENGGIGTAPKFPHVPVLELLWRAYLRGGGDAYRQAVFSSLRAMCQGGIYDHLGGGMARYSVDAAWLVPHFEKMLYDNASLLSMLAMVQPMAQDPLFALRAQEIVGFLHEEMASEWIEGEAAFAASWDADSEGEEGKYYVWSRAEIKQFLGEETDFFCRHYDVSDEGNWEGKNILNRLRTQSWLGEETETRLAQLRAKLRHARLMRIKPGFDDKVLADWNGMTISALARAGLVFSMPSWVERAKTAYRFIMRHLVKDGRLYHSWRAGQLGPLAHLDDYVQLASAAVTLYEVSGEDHYLQDAISRVEELDREYWDSVKGGYFSTASQARDIILRQKTAYDGATPNGNGIMVGVLWRLWHLTGVDIYQERALALEKVFAGEIERNVFSLATYLNAIDLAASPILVVICAEEDARQEFMQVLQANGHPNLILQWVRPGEVLPPGHAAYGKTNLPKAAFICRGQSCSLPLTDAKAVEENLKASYR